MFDIVLHEPQIPPNTGNVIRLAANTGSRLHLIRPLGFELDDKRMRRAGLDYREFSEMKVWDSFAALQEAQPSQRCFMLSTHHQRLYTDTAFATGDMLVFGAETHGLPIALRESIPEEQRLRLPMMANNRSLNLSNTVAIVVYEAWRQLGFTNASDMAEL